MNPSRTAHIRLVPGAWFRTPFLRVGCRSAMEFGSLLAPTPAGAFTNPGLVPRSGPKRADLVGSRPFASNVGRAARLRLSPRAQDLAGLPTTFSKLAPWLPLARTDPAAGPSQGIGYNWRRRGIG